MGKMAIGYGSEYQLLRFLGHHRNFLDNEILKSLCKQNETLIWFDYPTDIKRHSLDGELKGIECFEKDSETKEHIDFIKSEWKKFWPTKGNCQNWDGIFKIKDEWYFVEAKARRKELSSICDASKENSLQIIKQSFSETIKKYSSSFPVDFWISKENKAYQLSNRLAFLVFCEKIGIKAHLVYINFINGFNKPGTHGHKNISSKEDWEKIWYEEYKLLGIKAENLKEDLFHVYIDCEK